MGTNCVPGILSLWLHILRSGGYGGPEGVRGFDLRRRYLYRRICFLAISGVCGHLSSGGGWGGKRLSENFLRGRG